MGVGIACVWQEGAASAASFVFQGYASIFKAIFDTRRYTGVLMRRILFPSVLLLLSMTLTVHAQSAGSVSTPAPEDGSPNAAGIYKVGGDVRPPVVLSRVDPEYSEEARHKKLSGEVEVGLIVDKKGRPRNVHVVRGVGMGLDENAVRSVRGYRFQPATKGGTAVPVEITIEVNFQIL